MSEAMAECESWECRKSVDNVIDPKPTDHEDDVLCTEGHGGLYPLVRVKRGRVPCPNRVAGPEG